MPTGEVAEWLIANGDPLTMVVTLVGLILLAFYVRLAKNELRRDVSNLAKRVSRLETKQMRADGGEPP